MEAALPFSSRDLRRDLFTCQYYTTAPSLIGLLASVDVKQQKSNTTEQRCVSGLSHRVCPLRSALSRTDSAVILEMNLLAR